MIRVCKRWKISKYHGGPTVLIYVRRKPLTKSWEKSFFCTVVSEDVEIGLKNKSSLGFESKNEVFVHCNQLECQYVDLNESPCPLRLDIFSEEIEKREKKRRDRRSGL